MESDKEGQPCVRPIGCHCAHAVPTHASTRVALQNAIAPGRASRLLATTLAHSILLLAAPALAQTWSATPIGTDWDDPANWNLALVPNAPTAVAEFGATDGTVISLNSDITLATLRLTADARSYEFQIANGGSLSLLGTGIENFSAATPELRLAGATLSFDGSATAANAFIYNDASAVYFSGQSDAGQSQIVTLNGAVTQFNESGGAGGSLFTTLGSDSVVEFMGTSSADNATLFTFTEGRTVFNNSATAGSAILATGEGGSIEFYGDATGGNAYAFTEEGGVFSISGLTSGGLTTGAIDGGGAYILGSNNLQTGSLGMNTNASGTISGAGGSLTKVGAGTLTLSGINTYSGGTSIESGTIAITADASLGDAAGNVDFDGGTLRTLAGLSSTRTITLFSDGGTIDTGGQAVTLAGGIGGEGTLTKTGSGTLTLTGISTHTGGTVVNAGALQSDSDSLRGDIVTANGTTIVFDQNTDGVYAGDMTGSSALIKQGTGTLTVTGTLARTSITNSEHGTLNVNGGTLEVDGGSITESASIVLGGHATNDGTLRITGSSARVETFGANNIMVGAAGTGRLLIENGGSMTTTLGVLGSSASGAGEMVVDGSGSTWTGSGPLIVGSSGTGALSIVNGGQVNSRSGNIGQNVTGTGDVLVSGAGSRWTSATGVALGDGGAGTITVTEGGMFEGANINLAQAGGTGTLNIGTGGAAGIVDADVISGIAANRSFLNLNHTDAAYTLDARLAEQLQVNHIGGGTTILTGNNDHRGGTNIQAGTLAISADTNLGRAIGLLSFGGGTLRTDAALTSSRSVMLNAGGGTLDTNGFDSLFSGAIDGAGGLTKTGAGTLTLTGTNTYSGGTTVREGTVSISADANLGNGAGGLAFDEGTLQLTGDVVSGRAVSLGTGGGTIETNTTGSVFSGVISGDGSLTKTGVGTLVLSGANTHGGGSIVAAGTLAISSDANLGASSAALNFSNGTLRTDAGIRMVRDVAISGSATVDTNGFDSNITGEINGSGSLTKVGAGTLTLNGTNSYAGGTRLEAGTLSISADHNLGAAAGTLTFDGGTLQTTSTFSTTRAATLQARGGSFDIASDRTLTYDGTVGGSGELRKLGAGTLILNGVNSYTGGTSVLAGTLRGDTTSLRGDIRNNATLVFDQQSDGTFYGAISGTGGLTKLGTEALTLRGANTYSGTTLIERGLLSVNGSLTSAVTVGPNAALGGSGIIHNRVMVERGATLAPGSSVTSMGTLTIDGPLTLSPGSRLVIDTDAAGNSDRVRVVGANGTATIGGSTLRMEAMGNKYRRDTTYTVLTADAGVSGTFAAVSSDLAFLTPSLSYETNAVHVTLTRNDLRFSDIAIGDNQLAVAGYLDDVLGVDELIHGFDILSADQARDAFGTISGEGLSSLPRASAASTARAHEIISTRLAIGAEDRAAFTPAARAKAGANAEELKAGGWARAIGSSGHMADGEEASGYTWDTIGSAVGFERKLASQLLVGASAMHTRSEVSFSADRRATGEITTPQALVYSSYTIAESPDRRQRVSRHVQLRGILGYARHEYETQRPIDIGLFSAETRGSHDAQEWSAQGEVEFVEDLGEFRLQTLFGVRYIRQQVGGYTETGGPAALTVSEATLESVAATAGGRLVRPVFEDRGLVEMRALWSRELNDADPSLTASLANASNDARFTVAGVPIFPDTFTLGASISAQVRERVFVHADYKAELWRSGRDQQSIIAGFSYLW